MKKGELCQPGRRRQSRANPNRYRCGGTSWEGWDVSEFLGKNARIELVDKETGAFGHILFDELVADDKPAINMPENAYWLDYGPDYYAVRSSGKRTW